MYDRTNYIEECISYALEPNEGEYYYFYNMKMASFKHYVFNTSFFAVPNTHMIVVFTNTRIIVFEMDGISGELTGNAFQIPMDHIAEISTKKGLLKTKINVVCHDDTAFTFNPNNVCIGLPNHKKGLEALLQKFN